MATRRFSLQQVLLASAVLLWTAAYGQAQVGAVHVMKPRDAGTAATTTGSGNLIDHGGAVVANSTTYAIWWGNPPDFPPDQQTGIHSFLQGLEGSDYLGIANQYMRGASAHTTFGGDLYDYEPPLSNFNNGFFSQFGNHVCQFLNRNGVQPDATKLYLVYTSNRPFGALFCAFHGSATCNNDIMQVAYLPNNTDFAGCDTTETAPLFEPNSYSQGTQLVINATAHEFMETITDPRGGAWFDSAFNEIGDKCAWLFQSGVPLTNSSRWKMQEEWSNQVSGCDQGAGFNVQVLGAFSNSGTLTTFTAPGATYGTLGLSINKDGAIVGVTRVDDTNFGFAGNRAFVLDPSGILTTFDAPGATHETKAYGINGLGVIAGYYSDASAVSHGFVRDQYGVFTTFDTPIGVPGAFSLFGYSINDMGAIAGSFYDANLLLHGFARDPNAVITTFDAPGSFGTTTTGTSPQSINRLGVIAGYYSDASAVNHGFVRDQYGTITSFDAPGAGAGAGQGTVAQSINRLGAIAGYYTDANNVNHGFVRDQYGTITTFDAPGAAFGTFAYSINAASTVAGYYSDSSGLPHAFVRTSSGKFSTPSAPGSSYGTVARSINDQGAIAGYATAPAK